MEYVFNDFVLDVKSSSLSQGKVKFKLEPRVLQLLLYFCQRPNQAITRDELIKAVWQDRIVGYAAVNRAVSELRKVIEEEVSDPKVIVTVSKVGYLFDSPVKVLNSSALLSDESIISTEPSNHTFADQTISCVEHTADVLNVDNDQKGVNPQRFKLTAGIVVIVFISILFYFLSSTATTSTQQMSLTIEKPLTSLKGTSFKGDLSPTGQDLVFLYKEKPNDAVQVWLKKSKQAAVPLTLDNYYYTYVIFAGVDFVLASRFNNLNERQCEIVKISLRNKGVERLFNCAKRAITNLSYQQSTNTAFFNYRRSITSAFNIFSYQIDSKSLQQITFTDITAEHGDFSLALSPSGESLAVLEYRDQHQALLKFIAVNSKAKQVTFGPKVSANSRISWLSEEQLLLADGDRLQTFDLNTQQISVLGVNTSIGFAKAHAESKQIIFDKGKVIANIYQYPLANENTAGKAAVTNSSFINYQMQFANLSKQITYFSTDSGDYEIMVKPEGGNAFNTDFPEKISVIANLDWSSNDDFLLAGINQQLYLYDINKNSWQLLLVDETSIHYVHFIDKENIAFSSKQSGQWQIWKMELATKALTQLTTKGGYSVQFSNDAAYITKYNSLGIFKLNLLTGDEQLILPEHKITAWKKWQLRDGKLYYINQQNLHQLDIETKSDNLLTTFELRAPASFSISFDHNLMQRELLESSSANIWLTKFE
ncbi:winged helix-turn-helix domain-containing protein [Colwellia psychrerythraea]|uniref:Transcriptional regulator, CadC n=1 Tax=Colwellia psychrerythraea TaxID=28229 RepID=A0A099L436_COLPS|nr:winged helix-turn-helix domain-containing protein [Colwellia psychrerythraea]KGJ96927.1 transcriptional regulator, CadC [Colwellia psychrerythraea]